MMNKWEKVLDIINEVQGTDIKMGEEFEIENFIRNPVVMTDEGLIDYNDNVLQNYLVGLIYGSVRIKPKKWVPKEGEAYFVPDLSTLSSIGVLTFGECDILDSIHNNRNIIRYTKEEAIALANKMLEVAKGDN